MRIVKLLLYGLFPCFLWSCEKEGTDQQYVEVPEGFALSAGTATNFLTSSKLMILKRRGCRVFTAAVLTTEMDCMTMCVPVVTRMVD